MCDVRMFIWKGELLWCIIYFKYICVWYLYLRLHGLTREFMLAGDCQGRISVISSASARFKYKPARSPLPTRTSHTWRDCWPADCWRTPVQRAALNSADCWVVSVRQPCVESGTACTRAYLSVWSLRRARLYGAVR